MRSPRPYKDVICDSQLLVEVEGGDARGFASSLAHPIGHVSIGGIAVLISRLMLSDYETTKYRLSSVRVSMVVRGG